MIYLLEYKALLFTVFIHDCSVVCIVEIKICKKKGKFVIPPLPPQKKKERRVKLLLNFQLALEIGNTTIN